MEWFWHYAPHITAVAAFAAVATAAYLLLGSVRAQYAKRREELALAQELIAQHFRAAEVLDTSQATPPIIRAFTDLLVELLARREFAVLVARQIGTDATETEPSPRAQALASKLADGLRLLQATDQRLFETFAEMFRSGVLAATMRWPETEALALRLAATSGDAGFVPKGSERVMKAVPEQYIEQLAAT
jgi:hypothetical protein